MPVFFIQIVESATGIVAQLPGGGSLEHDLIELCTQHIMARGVGFKTKGHVEKDVREGLKTAIHAMKDQTKFLL